MSNGVIDQATAERISGYYQSQEQTDSSRGNRLFLVFGGIGALLVSLGIMLIMAHNWDDFSRLTRTTLAFLPMLLGQLLCGYTLLRKPESSSWREASAVFLFVSVGGCIALIGQIYHLGGTMFGLLLAWSLLGLPLLYTMRSAGALFLYWALITNLAFEGKSYHSSSNDFQYLAYWPLMAASIPFLWEKLRTNLTSNVVKLGLWALGASLVSVMTTLMSSDSTLAIVAYIGLFGLLMILGRRYTGGGATNGFHAIGVLGTLIVLLMLSFDWFWKDLHNDKWFSGFTLTSSPEVWLLLISYVLATILFWRKSAYLDFQRLIEWSFLLFLPVFAVGCMDTSAGVAGTNLLLLAIAISFIKEGASHNYLGKLNIGLLTISILLGCRFFDLDLSFVVRGIAFVVLGLAFFGANWWMLKKSRAIES